MENNRNFVFVTPSVHGTTTVVNYSGKSDVNTFLHRFDIWDSWGHQVMCSDENHSKFEFECSKEFYAFCITRDFKRAFRSMGVELVFEYEYDRIKDID